ncbi:MAG: CDP-glycerol:poly(glycerophosphate) glycerophosphotransferase [uncultured Friedmanniella sp.]|uniref:CDP-glycerol:poly(Glycerophosphate) glycerophosphotransferase n=1 Tax=uncultured Friedmanniella sp. TaxID=335381 RepID=A0A6J4JSS2_9ACTN|nr:MAG: CDP-glycerol:poly(glycerophosphate) glycerophosphotransferase [uncultured Friedmanniella sp.]
MKVVYDSFEGRYSDSPRALYTWMRERRPQDEHVWLCDPRHAATFPRDVVTVPVRSERAVAALESADLVVGNTHIELDWVKKPGARYLQTWHGTPLKRIHRDSLWAPPGVVDGLLRDVDRWDHLVSPNAVSTPRLRRAFGFEGKVWEVGYPRNDVLSSPTAPLLRARVRALLGLPDGVTAVLYAPTWRDREFYLPGAPPAVLELDVDRLLHRLGPGHVLLTRLHPKMTDRAAGLDRPGVVDVSRHPEVHELYLAADVLVTDYSSVMFDFAVTGKPILFYAYDLEAYRDDLRGFYFDLEEVAPGPVTRTTDELSEALADLPGLRRRYDGPYAEFRRLFSHLEDGRASERLEKVFQKAVRRTSRRELRAEVPALIGRG